MLYVYFIDLNSNFRFGTLIAFDNCFCSRSPKDSCGEAQRTQSQSNKPSILSTFCLKSTFANKYFCHKSVKAEIAEIQIL